MDAELDKYAADIRALAAKNKLPLADLRKLFTSYDAENNADDAAKGVLTTDGVHLNAKGNDKLAQTLLPFIK